MSTTTERLHRDIQRLKRSTNAGGYYRHVQSVPAAIWAIAHNMGKRPAITVADSAGSLVVGEIVYVSDDKATVTFSSAFSGEAYCN